MSKFAIVFPGQGSQSIGMSDALAESFACVKQTYEEASDALGYDLWNLVSAGDKDELGQTQKTQPALLTASIGVWRAWQENNGAMPAAMAGHSLGEYSALVAAGCMNFSDAVKLVEARGNFMQQAVPAGEGAMAAILGLDDETVRQLCADNAQGEVLSAVNYNSPGQVVVAGTAAAVERMMPAAKEAGAKRALKLAVSAPSHCDLMKPAAEQLQQLLADTDINTPNIPVINNADVTSATDANDIRDALVRQLYSPVRWVESVQAMKADGIEKLVEAGPGKVLAGLNRRIDKSMKALPAFDPASLEEALAATAG